MRNGNWLTTILILGLAFVCNQGLAQGPPLNRMVVFGDSLCDTGNLYQSTQGGFPFEGPGAIFPIDFYPEGKFCNGPIWIETFAPAVGFALPENFTTNPFGGTNLAFGGAETGIGDSLRMAPNIGKQIQFFASTQVMLQSDDLVLLWAGGNDFNPIPPNPLPTPEQVVANMVSRITELNQLGGQYFLIPNVPPLGNSPEALAQGPLVSFLLNFTVFQYNLLLNQALNDLEHDLGITVFRMDTFGLVSKATDEPQQFGFTNVTEPAFDLPTLTVAPDSEQYLYWDTIHPTSFSHNIFGKVAVNAYLIGSMKAAFASNESWGIDVTGWFGRLKEAGLVFRLDVAKFHLNRGNLAWAEFYLRNYRAKVASLESRGRLSESNASWLNDQATTAIDCLESIQN